MPVYINKCSALLPVALVCMLQVKVDAQIWTFEYEAEAENYPAQAWMLPHNGGSFHCLNVQLVPASGKDGRGRLLHLDADGNPESLFTPKECEVQALYYPYHQDQIISLGRDCSFPGKTSVSIFNSAGHRTWFRTLDTQYFFNHIISSERDFIFVQEQLSRLNADHCLITVMDKEGHFFSDSISLSTLREPGHQLAVGRTLLIGDDDYLLTIRIYDVDKGSMVHPLFCKLVRIKKGHIQWVKTLENTLTEISDLALVQDGIMVIGKDTSWQTLVLKTDMKGKELFRFAPVSASNGLYTSFYIGEQSILSIDKRVRGTTIYLKSFDLNGNLKWERTVETTYRRIEGLKIIGADSSSFLVTGACIECDTLTNAKTFIMKFEMDGIPALPAGSHPTVKKISADIIEEIADEIRSVSVYPNPVRFELTFELEGPAEPTTYHLRLYNMNGQEVLKHQNTGSVFSVDVSHLPSATYFYAIKTLPGQSLLSGKIIKQ